MMRTWMRKPATLGLSLGATMMAAVFGCGGQATDSSDAVVVPDSTAPVGIRPGSEDFRGTGGGRLRARGGLHQLGRPRQGRGLRHPQGSGRPSAAMLPRPRCSSTQGKAPKDPEVCAKDGPLVDEKLIVDGATKGVKNVLIYIPRPTSVSDEAKKAYSATPVLFDQEKCVFVPHVIGIMAGSAVTLKSSDPVNHNINARLKQERSTSCSLPRGRREFTPVGCRAHARRGHLRHSPLDEGLVDGPRSSLFRRDRRQGILRDQERPGRNPEGGGLAGGRRQERLHHRAFGRGNRPQGERHGRQGLQDRAFPAPLGMIAAGPLAGPAGPAGPELDRRPPLQECSVPEVASVFSIRLRSTMRLHPTPPVDLPSSWHSCLGRRLP